MAARLEERIFKPLGMIDTFFNVPQDKLDRVAQPGRSRRRRNLQG